MHSASFSSIQDTGNFPKNCTTTYSYTIYDDLNRIVEVGQKTENLDSIRFGTIFGDTVETAYNPNVVAQNKYLAWIDDTTGPRTEVIRTYYDKQSILDTSILKQQHLRNRVATVTYTDTLHADTLIYSNSVSYSYDVHGNVNTLIQDDSIPGISGQRYKRVDYQYDLISGNLNEIDYQNDSLDAFHEKYTYDADNRIINVQSSRDSILWDNEANYFYYPTSLLARVEIGDQQVQGIDFAYTLSGWPKIVNSDMATDSTDMGKDGYQDPNNLNSGFARDAFGYSLDYFTGDYDPIDTAMWNKTKTRFESVKYGSDLMAARHDLFDGNVSAMVTTITKPAAYSKTNTTQSPVMLPQGTAYNYDQLSRLVESKAYANIDTTTNIWESGSTYDGRYYNHYTYDANGNILSAHANNQAGQAIDEQAYHYQTAGVGGRILRNRLYAINDSASITSGNDLLDQAPFDTSAATINKDNNYSYDAMGEMIKDSLAQIDTIEWTVYGKVKKIIRTAGSSKDNIVFDYDTKNNRIDKRVYDSSGNWIKTEHYVRDAQGNLIAVYDETEDPSTSTMKYKENERYIYGSSLLGIDNTPVQLIGAIPVSEVDTFSRYLGLKQYQLANHLGNVLATVTDRKIPRPNAAGDSVKYYVADVLSSMDYAPYGGYLTERTFDSLAYPNSFNGKRDDRELGDWQDYGSRMYMKWARRFPNTDPLAKKYPYYSPYEFAGGKPIESIDMDGKEELNETVYKNSKGAVIKTVIWAVNSTTSASGVTDGVIKIHRSEVTYDDKGNATVQYMGSVEYSSPTQISSTGPDANARYFFVPYYKTPADLKAHKNSYHYGTNDAGQMTFGPDAKGTVSGVVSVSKVNNNNISAPIVIPGSGKAPNSHAYLPLTTNAVPKNPSDRTTPTGSSVIGGSVAGKVGAMGESSTVTITNVPSENVNENATSGTTPTPQMGQQTYTVKIKGTGGGSSSGGQTSTTFKGSSIDKL